MLSKFSIAQMWFQSFSERFIGFKAYDTRYLHFCRIPNWGDCRSQFWSNHMTLVKLSYFFKKISTSIVQLYFQSSSQWVLRFRTYNRHCPAFLPNIKLGLLRITVLKPSRVFGKTSSGIWQISFHYYRLNIFSRFLSMAHWFQGF